MTRRKVHLSGRVQAQIRAQVRYIAKDSPDRAIAWQKRVHAVIAGLATFAGFAVDRRASDRVGYPVHKLVFERTYLVFYRVDDQAKAIFVISFRHGRIQPGSGQP